MKQYKLEVSVIYRERYYMVVSVKDDMPPNVVACIYRPPYGAVHGLYDIETGALLYTDEQKTY